MSAFSLTEYLLRPTEEVKGGIFASQAAQDAAQAPASAAAPALQTVMRSSRARAWIPAHLIESLRDA